MAQGFSRSGPSIVDAWNGERYEAFCRSLFDVIERAKKKS